MKILLNNEWKEFNVLKAPPIKTAIDDSLDTATVIFYTDFKEAIEKNTLVEIHGQVMCVFNDQSVPISKNTNKWQHTLSLIETTHLLDLIYVNNICLTNRNDTLVQQLHKLTQNIAFFSNSFINLTQIHYKLENALEGLKSAEIYCQNSTAKECYNELLRTINARIELQVLDTTIPVLYWLNYRSGSKRNNLVSFNKMSSLYTYESSNMTNNLTFIGKNAVTRHPITQGFEGFKTTKQTLTSDNAQIILMHQIEDIKKFEIKYIYSINVQVLNAANNVSIEFVDRDFELTMDLTENIIEEEAYNLLTSLEQQDKIPYSQNNVIQVGSSNIIKTILFGVGNKISQIAVTKGFDYVRNNINELMKGDAQYPSESGLYTYGFGSIPFDRVPIDEIVYKMTYFPFLNINGQLTKDINKEKTFTIVDNQQEEVLSIEKYSDLLDNKIKRIGNMEIEIDEINQPIKQLNDYTEDGYVIYEREIAESTNEVKVHYKLSKDYNLLNNRLAVDQRKRLFEIPLDYQDCYLTDNHYVFVSDTLPKADELNKDVIWTGLQAIAATLTEGVVDKTSIGLYKLYDYLHIGEFHIETYKQNEQLSKYLLFSGNYALANTLHFTMLMYDNYSSALSIGGQVLGGKKAIYNPYVNANGEFDKLTYTLDFASEGSIEGGLLFPQTYKTIPHSDQATYPKEIIFNKDRVQRIGLDIAINIQSKNKDVLLGKEFYQNNCLIQEIDRPRLYFYFSTNESYGLNDLKAKGIKSTSKIDTLFKVNIKSIETEDNLTEEIVELVTIVDMPENITSWSIADEDGNIYIAVNGNVRPIYFY